MSDFEALITAYSVLQYKLTCGPMHLVTDSLGARYLEHLGILQLYDEVHVKLDSIVGIDPVTFWAAGKLYAYELIPAPCISLDMDAVLFKPLPHQEDVTALHVDNALWDCYAESRAMYAACGFKSRNWDWSLPPLNVGLLQFRNEAIKNFYTSTSIAFMECFTNFYSSDILKRKVLQLKQLGRKASIFEQIFAEQRILSLCVGRAQGTFSTVSEIDPKTNHLAANPYVTHVWGIKNVYRSVECIRKSCVSYLVNLLSIKFPESRLLISRILSTVKSNHLPFTGHPDSGDFNLISSNATSGSFGGSSRLLKVLDTSGTIYACDLCFGHKRLLSKGSYVLVGERLLLQPRSTCTLRSDNKVFQIYTKTPQSATTKDGFYATKIVSS
jgi:hypothetical protein